jgi:hypothetical protein
MEQSRRNISVIDLLVDAFRVFVENKSLWGIGVLFAFFGGSLGGGMSANFSLPSSYSRGFNGNGIEDIVESGNYPIVDNIIEQWESFSGSTLFWPVAWTMIGIFIIWIIAGIYVRTVAKGALVKSEQIRRDGQKFNFKELWRAGHKGFFQVLIIGILYAVLGVVLSMLSLTK